MDEKQFDEDIETSENNDLNEELDDNSSEETTDDTPSLEDYQELQDKYKELEDKNKQLYARIKKTDKSSNQSNKEKSESITEEDLLRISKVASSLDDDDIEMLKTINGASIADKIDNPLFKAYKAEKERKERSKKASLKPSVSGTVKELNKFSNPDLTVEEHRKMWEEAQKS